MSPRLICLLFILINAPALAQQSYNGYGSSSASAQWAASQRENERRRAEATAQWAANEREKERQRSAATAQWAANEREKERQRSAANAQWAATQRENRNQTYSNSSQRTVVANIGGVNYYSAPPPVAHQDSGAASVVNTSTPQPPKVYLSRIDVGVTAYNGVPIPPGATHYLIQNGVARYYARSPSDPNVPVEISASKPAPQAETLPAPVPPKESYPALYTKFSNQSAVGNYAYFQLFDEPIGPQSIDSPVLENPVVEDAMAEEVNKNHLSKIKALFDNSELPAPTILAQNSAWGGRCVFRSSPDTEVGALLAIATDNQKSTVALATAVGPTGLGSSSSNAQADRYVGNVANSIEEAKRLMANPERAKSTLNHSASEDRPFARDALFFDAVEIDKYNGKIGYRLRTFIGPTGKTVLVAEAYSAFKEDADFVGKKVGYLEPIYYCYFTRAGSW